LIEDTLGRTLFPYEHELIIADRKAGECFSDIVTNLINVAANRQKAAIPTLPIHSSTTPRPRPFSDEPLHKLAHGHCQSC
jgi:hypothetical protein